MMEQLGSISMKMYCFDCLSVVLDLSVGQASRHGNLEAGFHLQTLSGDVENLFRLSSSSIERIIAAIQQL